MNKKKIIIVRIAEGLGNQLFMFANSYFLAKVKKCTLMIDDESGYFKNKNQLRKREFLLNFFNINNKICSDKLKFKNYLSDLFRKLLKILDYFKYKKKFLIEYKNKYKNTYFKSLTNYQLDNVSYIEGHFESEKYFFNFGLVMHRLISSINSAQKSITSSFFNKNGSNLLYVLEIIK